MTSNELLKRLDFTEDDFIDCADVLDKHGFHCEARMIRWSDARIREQDAAIAELVEALEWALRLAVIATEEHRLRRIKAGHNDIQGTYKDGKTWVGIHQAEVDEIEHARALIAKHKAGE